MVRSFSSILQAFAVASFLLPRDFGLYALAMSYVGIVFAVLDFRTSEAAIKFGADALHAGRKRELGILAAALFLLDAAKAAGGALIIAATAWPVSALFYGEPELAWPLTLLALYQVFMAFNPTMTAFLRIAGRYRLISWYDGLFGPLSLCVVGATAYATGSLSHVAVAYAATGLVGALVKAVMCRIVFPVPIRPRELMRDLLGWRRVDLPWRQMAGFIFHVSLTTTLRYFSKNLDVLILGKFVSAESVGIYSLTRRLAMLLAYFFDPLSIVIYPEMARLSAEGDTNRLRRLFVQITGYATAAVLVGFAVLAVSSRWLVLVLFGEHYAAVPGILWLFMPGVVFILGFFSVYHLLLALRRTGTIFIGTVIQLLATLVCIPPLAWQWQAPGTAIGYSAALIIPGLYYLVVLWRLFARNELSQSAAVS